jgi:hypothetical protein
MLYRFLTLLFFLTFFVATYGQLVINEVVSSNNNGIIDEDGEHVDWIELYNKSGQPVNLEGYVITDKKDIGRGWVFPRFELPPNAHLLVYASGKDRKHIAINYKTIIDWGDDWQYAVPPSNRIKNGWRLPGYDASDWQTGPSGFGYGDGDDNTVIQPLMSIYIRHEFHIERVADIHKLLLHVDYDDGFIAFINGNLVATGNAVLPDPSNFENVQINTDREAQLYQGGLPVKYDIDLGLANLKNGTNVFAIQGYNVNSSSSDFSLIPFLTLGSTHYPANDISKWIGPMGEGGLHTNFSISKDGEAIYLYNPQLTLIDSVFVVPLPSNVSYGRYPDGSNSWKFFPTPTPGTQNTSPVDELRNDVVNFSRVSGFYTQNVNVALSSPSPGVVIRYTTDGSLPTLSSQAYTAPLTATSTLVLRAATFHNGQISGEVYTGTYFRNNGHQLPVVSISSDPKNFFDYHEGILVEGPNAQPNDPKYGANYWMDWEKPINLEYFDRAGIRQINQQAGLKIFGGWSRMRAQKSMSVFARNQYGSNRFAFPFFSDRKHTEYKAFIIRNSGNDWDYTMLRDGYVSEVVKNLDVDRLAYQPTVVYLNGEYWGILNMREKPNEHYLAANHGVDPDNVNRLEANIGVVQGSGDGYSQMINFIQNRATLRNANEYTNVLNAIDVECFIDYQAIQIIINNRDWPGNNIKYWNTDKEYSRWRWILYDTDFGLGLYGSRDYTLNTIEFATAPNGPSWPNPPWSTLLLRKLLTNDDFKFMFINRMADLLNTTFTPENMNHKLDSVSNLIESEIGNHQNRWGRNYSQWQSRVRVISDFNDSRPDYMREHIVSYFGLTNQHRVHLSVSGGDQGKIKVNSIIPESYPFSGTYFSDVPLMFTALPNPGFRFVRWENASTSNNNEITLNLTKTTRLHAVFEPDYSDNYNIVINEINYRSDEVYNTGDWIELYNAGHQTVDLEGWRLTDSNLGNAYVFKKGEILYPGKFMVVTQNNDRFSTVHPKVPYRAGDFSFGLSADGETITLSDPQHNTVDWVHYYTALPWPVEPLNSSASLELRNPLFDKRLAESWQAGPPGGTPGRHNSGYTNVDQIDLSAHSASCFPTRFSDYTTLRFYSLGHEDYSVSIYDIQGRAKNRVQGKVFEQGTQYLDIFTEPERYPKGVYLVKLQTGRGVETIKVVKQ